MSLEKIINDAWEIKDQINQNSNQEIKNAINQVINDPLRTGELGTILKPAFS